jgi:arylsulfate sulfotransferase
VKKRIMTAGMLAMILAMGMTACANADTKEKSTTKKEQVSESDEKKEQKMSDNEANVMNEKQKKIYEKIKKTYNAEEQQKIADELEKKKESQEYTLSNMLIEYNPFGTNTQSLYVYFETDSAVKVSYTIHVKEDDIADFSRNVYQDEEYQKEHEFQVIGLIPDTENTITFYITNEDGSTDTKEIVYEMGSLYGEEAVQLDTDVKQSADKLEDGLYVVLGNDSPSMDFMYYYDNNGVLRGEVPLLGYRSHRLIFDENSMYYSISEKKMAQVNRLGQVTKVYDLGNYKLHHDYVFDENGNMLILATDTTQDSVEDIVLKLDVNSGEVTEVLDLGDLFGEYKKTCVKNSSDELDWMHINTIQYIGNGSVLLSSRETSTIIKVDNIYDGPVVSYMIGEKDFWKDTSYVSLLLNKKGDFTIQGGQHTITYETDESLSDGQYYLYMFDNNIGISETRPDYDWSSIGLKVSSAVDGKNSKYYKYLVDENEGTFELVDSFKVPYSGYVSSAQETGDNVLVDSGLKGTFTEYDVDHKAIVTYKMDYEKFIYRVFKYKFDGFYFEKSE